MSSDSDDRVSDHGHQIVESIEPIEDVQMEDVGSSDDGRLEVTKAGVSSQHERFVKQEPVSDNESEESHDSIYESDPSQGATELQSGRGRRLDGATDEGVTSDDDNKVSRTQLPPSYQKPSGVDSGIPSHASDSTNSADATGSRPQEDSMQKDVTRNKKKPRKRRASTHGPELQIKDEAGDQRPVKKTKKSGINRAYLDLLNQDIEHATSQGRLIDYERIDGRIALPSSQVGLTFWTSMEKELFFEALGRLGRDDTAGIAKRIHTKGEMEVRQYMKLLQDAVAHRRQQNELDPLGLEDFPSAIEISHECCQALEEVADDIAIRQERAEVAAEEHELGLDWLVSRENCQRLEDRAEDDRSKSAGVLRTKDWLSLSERFFMNAPTAEGNWQSVDGNKPSIRLTTLNNFHSLALTLTKRLVAASHYMALTRIRAESGHREVREFVRGKDVQAAALSLGLATQKPPLTGCVRRLGLSIYENPPKPDEASELEPMSVADVEEVLIIDGLRTTSYLRHQLRRITLSDDNSISSDSAAESSTESDEERDSGSASDDDDSQEEEEEEIKAEADEAILYSAIDPPRTKRERQALYRRVKAEREQDKYADAVDVHNGYQEEMKMWEILGQQPPEHLIDPGPPRPGRRVNLSVATGYLVGKDWRMRTRAMSEWESRYLSID